MPSPGLHAPLHLNGQGQGPFNNFNPSNNIGYAGSSQIRGPHPMQAAVGHHPMGMGHPNNLDLRSANQAQLLGGGVTVGGLRGFSGQGPPRSDTPPCDAPTTTIASTHATTSSPTSSPTTRAWWTE